MHNRNKGTADMIRAFSINSTEQSSHSDVVCSVPEVKETLEEMTNRILEKVNERLYAYRNIIRSSDNFFSWDEKSISQDEEKNGYIYVNMYNAYLREEVNKSQYELSKTKIETILEKHLKKTDLQIKEETIDTEVAVLKLEYNVKSAIAQIITTPSGDLSAIEIITPKCIIL